MNKHLTERAHFIWLVMLKMGPVKLAKQQNGKKKLVKLAKQQNGKKNWSSKQNIKIAKHFGQVSKTT